MRKYIKIVILIIVCILIKQCLRWTAGKLLVHILTNNSISEEQIKEEDKVKLFFAKEGYSIDIIGANTNGREHGGPFLYGWNWRSFEIGPETIVLYYYEEIDKIDRFLKELDAKTRENCRVSNHFVFYYDGDDIDIASTINGFCESEGEYE